MTQTRRFARPLLMSAGLVAALGPLATGAAQVTNDGPQVFELGQSGCRFHVPDEAMSNSVWMRDASMAFINGFFPLADDFVVEFEAGARPPAQSGQTFADTYRPMFEDLVTSWNTAFGESDDVVVESAHGFSIVRNESAAEVFEHAEAAVFLRVAAVAFDRLPVDDARARTAFARLHDAFECSAVTPPAAPARTVPLGGPFDMSFVWPGTVDSDRDEAALRRFPRPAQAADAAFTIDHAVHRVEGRLDDGSTIAFTLFSVTRTFDGGAEASEVRRLENEGLVRAGQNPRWLDQTSELRWSITVDPRERSRLGLRAVRLLENHLVVAEWTSEPDQNVSVATSQLLARWIEPILALPMWNAGAPSGRVDPFRVTDALERMRGRVERCFEREPLAAEARMGVSFDRAGHVTRTHVRGDESWGNVASHEAHACTGEVLRSLPLGTTFGGEGILFVTCRTDGCRIAR